MASGAEPRKAWSEEDLAAVERDHAHGLTVQKVVELFAGQGEKLTEATFRKYVQVGLLPRSVRVARAGKRRGSQGLYPPTIVRQIDEIRRLMGQGFTMEEIQREFLFVRGEIEQLTQQLDRIHAAVEGALARRAGGDDLAAQKLAEARRLGKELLARLGEIERRMSMRARMARAAV